MKYKLSSLLLLIFSLCSCLDLTPTYTWSFNLILFIFNEDLTEGTVKISSPDTTEEFKSGIAKHSTIGQINSRINVGGMDSNKSNLTKGWNPEEQFWVKIELPSDKIVYAMLLSEPVTLPEKMTEEEHSIFSEMLHINYTEHYNKEFDISNEKKQVMLEYVKRQVESGYKWAAKSSPGSNILWVGDRQ